MKKRYGLVNKYDKVVVLVLLSIVLFLTVGFSALSSELGIGDISALVRIKRDIRVSEVAVVDSSSDAISNWEEHNVKSVESSIDLPNSNSSITYNVKIVNLGNVEALISEISGLPNNLKYSISNYNVGDMLCDDVDSTQCKLGSTSTLRITIEYVDGGYDSNNTDYIINMNFNFAYMVDAVAKMGDVYYDSLQEAIDDVPTNNTETLVMLLKDSSEIINVKKNMNIVFDFGNNVLSNDGNNPVIANYGTVKITNGTVTSNAATNGAINNESTGNITFDGGRVIVTGGRQALYNNKGVATITGNSYLSSSASERAAVQNLSGGTLTITGGTIISTGSNGVNNAGNMTIGVKDNTVNNSLLLIQSLSDGITSTANYNFYDGIVKSRANPFNNVSKIVDMEDGYGIVSSTEDISGVTYKTAYLGISRVVKFNPNTGTVDETMRYIEVGHKIGDLPIPIKTGYDFEGWFTLASGGVQITKDTVINDDIIYYAHWTKAKDVVQIGNNMYGTIQEAINTVPTNNTQTTITLLKDINDSFTIAAGKNIIFDFTGRTISISGNRSLIENSGTVTILNGSLKSSGDQGIINNSAGSLIINGTELIASGTRQTVYITGGTVEIIGNSYLSSKTSGKPTSSNMERGTVQVISGSLIVSGGTIVGTKQQAISNEGTVTIGSKDGNVNATSPVLIGEIYGIKSTGTLNFYDGIIKGKTSAINGTVSDVETGFQVVNGTEVISGSNYYTSYLGTS